MCDCKMDLPLHDSIFRIEYKLLNDLFPLLHLLKHIVLLGTSLVILDLLLNQVVHVVLLAGVTVSHLG